MSEHEDLKLGMCILSNKSGRANQEHSMIVARMICKCRLVGRYVRIDDRLRTLGLCVKAMEVSCQNVVIRPFGHSNSMEQLWCQFREIVVRQEGQGKPVQLLWK